MKKLIVVLVMTIAFVACNNKKESIKLEHDEFIFGTMLRFVIYAESESTGKEAIDKAIGEMKRIDSSYNTKTEGSLLDNLNKNPQRGIEATDELIYLIKKAKETSTFTHGTYDISIAPLVNLWGFSDLNIKKVPSRESIEETLKLVDYRDIIVKGNRIRLEKENQRIDTGSFLKGYAIKKAKEVLEREGIKSGFISAVSSIETIGSKGNGSKWRIGVQNPANPQEIIKVAELNGQALGVSGDYQTYVEIDGKRYHHILDPRTGYPAGNIRMLAIITEDAFEADLYSTGFFPKKPQEILDIVEGMDGVEAFIVDKDEKQYMTKGMEKYLRDRK